MARRDTGSPPHARSLTRSSIASIVATGTEFLILPVLVHLFSAPRWMSFVAVQFVANTISFFLYKYWAFEAAHQGSLRRQYAKQGLVFLGSLSLNTAIPSWLSYRMGLEPVLSFALSNLIVYLGWNYPWNRYWVFRP
jgi:putative flippase GtrA